MFPSPGSALIGFVDRPLVITHLGLNATNGADIGPARPDRIIAYCGVGENDGAGGLTSFGLNSVAGTLAWSPSLADSFGMAYAVIPTGTTITGFSAAQFGLQYWSLWMITGFKYGYDAALSNAGAVGSLGCAVSSSKCAVAFGCRARGSGIGGLGSSGDILTAVQDTNFNHGGGGNPSQTMGHATTSGNGSGITLSASGGSYAGAMVFR